MSNLSTAHNVTKYDAKLSQAFTNQRLAKVKYKSTTKSPAKYPSVCASVPMITTDSITEHSAKLAPHIRAMLENAQDGIIRSLYEANDGKLTSITDQDISILACIEHLEAEAQGTRLTKEIIEEWFDADAVEILTAAFVDKWNWEGDISFEQQKKLDQVVSGHKAMFAALAGGKTGYNLLQCKGLLKVLELIDTSELSERLKARLEAMSNKPVDLAEML